MKQTSITPKQLIVNQCHPLTGDTNPGTESLPLRTIQVAADRAEPGDTILIHAGTYREEIIPPRGGKDGLPITYMAVPGEEVHVKGSEIITGWRAQPSEGVYSVDIPVKQGAYNPFAVPYINKLPRYYEQMKTAVPKQTTGQVFLDGQMLNEVDTTGQLEAMSGTWQSVDAGTRLLVHFPNWVTNPANHIVEVSLRKAVFRPHLRGLGYITLRGLILEHAANQAITYFWEKGFPSQQGLVSCRSGHHWVIEHNVIRYAKSIGLDIGSEGRIDELDGVPTPALVGYHRIYDNTISDNGQTGICGLGHIGTEIVGNVMERNNNLGAAAWEEAAIKTHFYLNGRIEGNLIRGNYCNGLWLDNVYQNIRVTRNVILDNKGAGIFVEMGGGPCLIDNNVIALQSMGNGRIGGNGIYTHDAGGIIMVHNLLAQNAGFGIMMKVAVERNYAVYPTDIRSFDEEPLREEPCHCRNQHIENNLFVKNLRGAINLPYPAEKAGDMYSDHNLYCDFGEAGSFGINQTGGAGLDQIRSTFHEKMLLVDPSEVKHYLTDEEEILVTRSAWQVLMGMDGASASAKLNNMSWQIIHPGPGSWLTFQLETGAEIICPAVDGVERDLAGNPIPKGQASPGPFQGVHPGGSYHFRLWPIAYLDGKM